jgi:hypothetical protein
MSWFTWLTLNVFVDAPSTRVMPLQPRGNENGCTNGFAAGGIRKIEAGGEQKKSRGAHSLAHSPQKFPTDGVC